MGKRRRVKNSKATKGIKRKLESVRYMLAALFFAVLFSEGYVAYEETGDNLFHVSVNGVEVGTTETVSVAQDLLWTARKNVASTRSDLTFMNVDLSTKGEEIIWGKVDNPELVRANMENVLKGSVVETMHKAYTVKVNEFMVNLATQAEVVGLLQAAVNKYDTTGMFRIEMTKDNGKEFNIFSAKVALVDEIEAPEAPASYSEGGVEAMMMLEMEAEEENEEGPEELRFEDYTYGIWDMAFEEKVEIVEAYLPDSQISTLDEAVERVIKDQEVAQEYTIVSGDTLSEISIKVNIPVDRIVELNSDMLESVNSPIRVGDKLIITSPEPELSVTRVERNYYEEIYDADVIYIDEDTWYTTQTQVLQQPSAGFRKAVVDEYFINDKLTKRDIVQEEVIMEAVAKIVKRGTKIPPTYIKPISGGRASSGFGPRKSPTKGASSNHKGQDWAVPTGTSVYASCGGTVAKAGWGSGYGYVVYINHADGKQTRYAHLSKVLVKAGDSVVQGQKIGLSGNTGISTGPHLHFEILVNGVQKNPLKYLS